VKLLVAKLTSTVTEARDDDEALDLTVVEGLQDFS